MSEYVDKLLVNIRTKSVENDTQLEIFHSVPNQHSSLVRSLHYAESIPTVMMAPVASVNGQPWQSQLSVPDEDFNPLKCDFCDKKFRLANRLKLHAKGHSTSGNGVERNEDKLSGKDMKNKIKTNKGFKSNPNIMDSNNETATQLKLNAKSKYYKCKFCDKEFAIPAHLSRHSRVHTGIRPFKCEKCDKAFKDASVLKRHLHIHSSHRPYCCEICNKSFVQNKDLKHHLQSHNGDRPHQCQTCKKCFSSASYLTVHERTHTGVRPHVCPVCNVGFHASGTLARHQRSHSKEKQFKCSICPKAYTRSTTLKQHIHTHHSNE